MPQKAAGTRIEPPVSLPRASGYLVRRQGDGRAPARAARDPVRRPRVPGRAELRVHRRDPPGELVRLRLAEEDRAGGPEPPDRLGVLVRDVVEEERRAVGGAYSGRVEEILGGERHAGERGDDVTSRVGLGPRSRLLARPLEAQRRERAHGRVDRLDPPAARLDDLARRESSRDSAVPEPAARAPTERVSEIGRAPARRYTRDGRGAAGRELVDDDVAVDDHRSVVQEQAAAAHRDIEVAVRVVGPAGLRVRAGREQHVAVERAGLHPVAAPIGREGRPLRLLVHPPADVREAVGVGIVEVRHVLAHELGVEAALDLADPPGFDA